MTEIFRTALAAVMCAALAFATFWCVTRVGGLNGHADFLATCLHSVQQYSTCPQAPISAGQIATLHDEADTVGALGWVAFIGAIIFGIGTVYELL